MIASCEDQKVKLQAATVLDVMDMSARNSMITLVAVALIALVIGLAVGYFIPRPSSSPTIGLSASSVTAGTQFTAMISGFPANVDVYGWAFDKSPPTMFKAGTTDAQGNLNTTGNAPTTPGTYLLCASDKENEYWAQTILTVTSP